MISKLTIARVQEEARVEEVVGEFVALKRRGSNLMGLCPFHNEKTPSFTVSPAKGIYKCFGCGKSGNAVSFLMEQQQMGFADAIRYLAAKYHIPIEEDKREYSPEEEEEQNRKEALFVANAHARTYYAELLQQPEGSIGLSYFKERGFTKAILEKFELGYAPDGWDTFYREARAAGYQEEVLKEAGLITEKNGKYFDFFRDRVLFPIHNFTGKVLGFGGRILKKDEKSPKYLNTGQTPIYNKTEVLYGLYQSRNAIRKQDECLLVEGYTDVISLHQAGIENVVASSGTSLTREQIRLVRRMTQNLVILYDGDSAGIKAALRGVDLVLEEGLHLYVVVLPPEDDPDSFVRSKGGEALLEYIRREKKDAILFRVGIHAKEDRNDPIQKAEFIKDISQTLSIIPDAIERQVYIKESAHLLQVEEQLLISEVNRLRRKRNQGPAAPSEEIREAVAPKQAETVVDTLRILERDVLRILLDYGTMEVLLHEPTNVVNYIREEMEGITIETPELKELYDYIMSQEEAGHVYDSKFYFNHSRPEFGELSRSLLFTQHEISPNWSERFGINLLPRDALFLQDIQSCMTRLKQYHVEREMLLLEEKLRVAESEQEQLRIMGLMQSLKQLKTELNKMAGTVVYRPTIRKP